ncbi:hypothetical protein MBM_04015 [Drepanopeziza brunnea f. sp. 'multigermtubi' MB_m1]|uniref:Uncharacterized protein n=1 Tax=Marssonina brunnea f. sp. multigermtubi (strain MB_m1) TaxID=1072389 RepID=K1WX83_MARBU|nr:uncharacterized protein MBM_04015 [Drepanopeziza brunnea f. sp. 'multigermtubi' MB_m1]EKD17646.1 hypothetical protein MBM_04015 [Drepanopeziza brunnea f. sp. 'multigermtubi' MB_m1]
MPHVVTQWDSDHVSPTDHDGRLSTELENATLKEYLRPFQIYIRRPRRAGGARRPNLKLLAARELEKWESKAPRVKGEASVGRKTPLSATESLFEMYYSDTYGSPNSSAYSSTESSFVAELEDTAMNTTRSRSSCPPSSNKQIYI